MKQTKGNGFASIALGWLVITMGFAAPMAAQTTVAITRTVEGDGAYLAGSTLDITVTFTKSGSDEITQLGLAETLPAGWTYHSTVSGQIPDIQPTAGDSGTIDFGYLTIPSFPASFTYRLHVPSSATGTVTLSGYGIYAVGGGSSTQTPTVNTEIPYGGVGEGEGGEEGEVEGESEGSVSLARGVGGDGSYHAGSTLDITVTLTRTGTGTLTQLGVTETLPTGWSFKSLVSGSLPPVKPATGATGTLGFAWITIPAFPVTFTYRINVPAGATGTKTIKGRAIYAFGGSQLNSPEVSTSIPEGSVGEGEGDVEGEGEMEGAVEGMELSRTIPAGGYVAGSTMDIEITLRYTDAEEVTSLALEETLPGGWTYASLVSGSVPNMAPSAGESGTLSFIWVSIPAFPLTFRYRVNAPASASGTYEFTGIARYRTTGDEVTSNEAITFVSEGVAEGEGGGEGEGEGEEEGEEEGESPYELTLSRTAVGGNVYVPGATVDLQIRFTYKGSESVTALALVETLPAGWTFKQLVSGSMPQIFPTSGDSGDLSFAWISIPSFPATFVYRVNVSPSASGPQTISGTGSYRTTGTELATNTVNTIVQEQQKADLSVTNASLPAHAWVGEHVTVSWTVLNDGVYLATAPWNDCLYLSSDDQPGGDTALGCADHSENLAVGESYVGSHVITIPTITTGDFYIIIKTDDGAAVYEEDDDNNVYVAGPIRLETIDYTATVTTEVNTSLNGEPIMLTGQATYLSGGAPVPNAEVTIEVMHNGVVRYLQVWTDGSGNFSTEFVPLLEEAGEYSFGARHPGASIAPEQDTSTILGLMAQPPNVSMELTTGEAQEISFDVMNLGDSPLTGLHAVVSGDPANITVTPSIASSLPGNGMVPLNVTVLAEDNSTASASAVITVSSAEGASSAVQLDFSMLSSTLSLKVESSVLRAGALRNSETLFVFDVTNQSDTVAEDFRVESPEDQTWILAAAPADPVNIDPGRTLPVTIQLIPDTSVAIGEVQTTLRLLWGSSGSMLVPFYVNVTDTDTGSLQITVTDELTLTETGQPKVSNARVVLWNPATGAPVTSAVSNILGRADFTDIASGAYNVEVYAAEHGMQSVAVEVQAGRTLKKQVQLKRNFVRQEWTVVQTGDTPDVVYEENTVVEEGRQAAVVEVNPPVLDLSDLTSTSYQTEIIIQNHGLLPAHSAQLALGFHPRFTFTPLLNVLGVIEPGESVHLPILVEDTGAKAESDCSVFEPSGLLYAWEVDGSTEWRFEPIAVRFPATECTDSPPQYGDYSTAFWEVAPYANMPVFRLAWECGVEGEGEVEGVIEGEGEGGVEGAEEGQVEGEGQSEGQIEGQTEGETETEMTLTRTIVGGSVYTPGSTVDVTLTLTIVSGNKTLTSLGLQEFIPDGWEFNTLVGGSVPQLGPQPGDTGTLGFVWFSVPTLGQFPLSFTYRMNVPAFASGTQTISGEAIYRTDGNELSTGIVDTNLTHAKRLFAEKRYWKATPCVTAEIVTGADLALPLTGVEATLTLGAGDADLTEIQVVLSISDSEGNDANSLFAVFPIEYTGISGISGDGALTAGASATIRWRIIPLLEAGAGSPVGYAIGGQLSFIRNSDPVDLSLVPAALTVYPTPGLDLHVFYPASVYADDPLTPETDAQEPFPAGMLIYNFGSGVAQQVSLLSARPELPAINGDPFGAFEILEGFSGDTAIPAAFETLFGNIGTGTASVAYWMMRCAVSGTFDSLNPTIAVNDARGLNRVIALGGGTFHDLLHIVNVNLPSGDGLPDFLVNDTPDEENMPDFVFTGTGDGVPVAAAENIALTPVKQAFLSYALTASVTTGWTYFRVENPASAEYVILSIKRSDGGSVAADNIWLTRRIVRNALNQPVEENLLHFLDFNSTGSYTVTFKSTVQQNTPPVADAGEDQAAYLGTQITLDGSGSNDIDGQTLSYAWSFVSKPTGSAAVLTSTSVVNPKFTCDLRGGYVLQLIVNDGFADSDPDTVTVTVQNRVPVANAGNGQTRALGQTVTLNGSGSSDPDFDPLTYAWSFSSVPAESTATLSDPTSVTPTFVLDQPGTYLIQLIVNDGFDDSAPSTVTVKTSNIAPTANAGPDTSGQVGDSITLDGSGSSDPDGDPLTYQWAFVSRPAGSVATLHNAATVSPDFTIDKPGTFIVQLTVNDGVLNSTPDSVVISTQNTPPVADAGPDQTAKVGDTVYLDGSGSSDADNNPLAYVWTIVSQPAGSTATLMAASSAKPSIRLDFAGSYTIQLVVNDGRDSSAPDEMVITTTNSAPVADAGPDQFKQIGQTAQLDGSGSSDVDGDALTYAWTITEKPSGSTAALNATNSVTPSFSVDKEGTYVIQLIVNDGKEDSAPDSVTISTENAPPTADAGPDQSVPVGANVVLDGSGSSDPEGNSVNYTWSFTVRPAGSTAVLLNSNTAAPHFFVDKAGEYTVKLIVNDGLLSSAPDYVTISTSNSAPVANAGSNQTGQTGETITLDGSKSSDVDNDPLTFSWSFSSKPSGSAAVLNTPASVHPTFTIDLEGVYVVQLIVNDGTVNSAPATVTISTGNTPPTPDPGGDQTANVGDIVCLDGTESSDPDSDEITYAWSFANLPEDSTAVLDDSTSPTPCFTIDVPGTYRVQLIVSDGVNFSVPAYVVISTGNSPPVANAGTDQTAMVGAQVNLDGSGSYDVDGDPLSYAWSFTSMPPASTAALTGQSTVTPHFTLDVAGTYVVQLLVTDGVEFSAPDTVTITTGNVAPVAEAGEDQTRLVGQLTWLDGSGSYDAD
nr:PKD domain-containing protein [Candidatus Hydrogenedentota bacterium]